MILAAEIGGPTILLAVMNSRFADIYKRVDERFAAQTELMRQGSDNVNRRLDERLDDHGLRLARIEDGYIDIGQRVSRLEGRIGLYPPPAAEPEAAAALPAES